MKHGVSNTRLWKPVIATLTVCILLGTVPPASAATCGTKTKNQLTSARSAQLATVPQVVAGSQNLSTLLAAVGAADLADLLGKTGPITVFAPTNAAFSALPAGTVESLLRPENKDQLTKILSYHVVAGEYRLADVLRATRSGPVTLTTLSGQSITIYRQGNNVMIETPNGTSRVTRPNVRASNGVIHIINAVLLP